MGCLGCGNGGFDRDFGDILCAYYKMDENTTGGANAIDSIGTVEGVDRFDLRPVETDTRYGSTGDSVRGCARTAVGLTMNGMRTQTGSFALSLWGVNATLAPCFNIFNNGGTVWLWWKVLKAEQQSPNFKNCWADEFLLQGPNVSIWTTADTVAHSSTVGSFNFGIGNDFVSILKSEYPVIQSNWIFMAMTYNKAANTYQLRVNNFSKSGVSSGSSPFLNEDMVLEAGTRASTSCSPLDINFTTAVDEFGISKRTLTDSEIDWLYNGGTGRTLRSGRLE